MGGDVDLGAGCKKKCQNAETRNSAITQAIHPKWSNLGGLGPLPCQLRIHVTRYPPEDFPHDSRPRGNSQLNHHQADEGLHCVRTNVHVTSDFFASETL